MDANKHSSAFSLANIPTRNLPENTHTATAYFPHLNTQAHISEEKKHFFKKKHGKHLVDSKKLRTFASQLRKRPRGSTE